MIGLAASDMTARSLLSRFNSKADNNFVSYHSDEYDRLYDEAVSMFDDEKQTGLYRAMERNLTENAAAVYIQDMSDLVAVRRELKGLVFYPLYILDVSTLYWEQ